MHIQKQRKNRSKRHLHKENIFIELANPMAMQFFQPIVFDTKNPIALYGRQSTLYQVENNRESLDYQIEQQRKIIVEQYGWDNDLIVEYFQDFAESGTLGLGQRIGITQLAEDIEADRIKTVYVYLEDRLFRDKHLENVTRFARICSEHHVIIITYYRTYRMWIDDDREAFIEACRQAWKAFDVQINKRLIPMRVFASHSGKYDARHVNMGYIVDRDKTSQTYKRYIKYEEHAQTIREWGMRLIALQGNITMLKNELERVEGVHFSWVDDPKFNSRCTLLKFPGKGYRIGNGYGTLIRMFRNRVYIGEWKSGNTIRENNHPAIFTIDEWNTIQYLLDKWATKNRPKPKRPREDSLLRGLVLRPNKETTVSISPEDNEISFAQRTSPHLFAPDQRYQISHNAVQEMFVELFLERLLRDEQCHEYMDQFLEMEERENKDREHIRLTIVGMEEQRQHMWSNVNNPIVTRHMTAQMIGQMYADIAELDKDIANLKAKLTTKLAFLPIANLKAVIDLIREHKILQERDTEITGELASLAQIFTNGIHLTPLSPHVWSFRVYWEIWGRDEGVIWCYSPRRHDYTDEEIARIKHLFAQNATKQQYLEAFPFLTPASISMKAKRECGSFPFLVKTQALESCVCLEDRMALETFGLSLSHIAQARGARLTKGWDGEAYHKVKDVKKGKKHAIFYLATIPPGSQETESDNLATNSSVISTSATTHVSCSSTRRASWYRSGSGSSDT